jgi:hypothetical protein
MARRTISKTATFTHPFLPKGLNRILGAGDYRVVTDEDLVEQLSFPVYRRVATMSSCQRILRIRPRSRW